MAGASYGNHHVGFALLSTATTELVAHAPKTRAGEVS